jgi:Lhr-like helicase
LLYGRCLEFRRTEERALVVEEVAGYPRAPRWGGEVWPLSTELARRLYVLRYQAAEALRDGPGALTDLLREGYYLGDRAAACLLAHFQRQECVSEVPEPAACLVEVVPAEVGLSYYVHTPLNRAGNDALARVAVLRLARDWAWAASSVVADLGFVLFLPRDRELSAEEWRSLLGSEQFEADLTESLAGSVVLRERFRRVAQTGLMLLRNPLGRRRVGGRTWAERRLFEQVCTADPEFVLLRQARREVRAECCDGEAAGAFAAQLPSRSLRCRRLACPSPFAESWTQQAAGPADAVESPAEVLQRLHAALIGCGETLPE